MEAPPHNSKLALLRETLALNTPATQEWVPDDLRGIVLLCSNGIVAVSEAHRNERTVDSLLNRISHYWDNYTRVLYLPLEKLIDLQGDTVKRKEADSNTIATARDIIREAFDRRASDIHLRVHENKGFGDIRLRMDGLMVPMGQRHMKAGEINDICSVLVGVMPDIGNSHYNPKIYQNARIGYETGHLPDGLHALRLESGPKLGGSALAIRLLYDEKIQGGSLEERMTHSGYESEQRRAIETLTSYTDGVTLVTGPTGSGKTTSLFLILSSIIQADPHLHVMTVEDPCELEIEGATQIPVLAGDNAIERKDAFSKAIRHLLRMDPDVIMIGELRDAESSKLCVEACQTGHQVWSTVHANTAWKSLERLLDMFSGEGMSEMRPLVFDPDIVRGMISQRLVRKLCANCAQPLAGNEKSMPRMLMTRLIKAATTLGYKLDGVKVRGPGCKHCGSGKDSHGYKGRTVVAEVVESNYEMMCYARDHGVAEAERKWREAGGMSMMKHGVSKVVHGEIDAVNLESALGPIHVEAEVAAPVAAVRG